MKDCYKEQPTELAEDGPESIEVDVFIGGEKFDAFYDTEKKSWWVDFGGMTVGHRKTDIDDIDGWDYKVSPVAIPIPTNDSTEQLPVREEENLYRWMKASRELYPKHTEFLPLKVDGGFFIGYFGNDGKWRYEDNKLISGDIEYLEEAPSLSTGQTEDERELIIENLRAQRNQYREAFEGLSAKQVEHTEVKKGRVLIETFKGVENRRVPWIYIPDHGTFEVYSIEEFLASHPSSGKEQTAETKVMLGKFFDSLSEHDFYCGDRNRIVNKFMETIKQ
jgi:hypothetical protein